MHYKLVCTKGSVECVVDILYVTRSYSSVHLLLSTVFLILQCDSVYWSRQEICFVAVDSVDWNEYSVECFTFQRLFVYICIIALNLF